MAFARVTGHRCRDTGADRLGRSGLVAEKILGRWFSDDVQRAVVARGASGIEGYASFTFGSDEVRSISSSIIWRHLVATSVEGWASLLSYLRGSEVSGER